MFTNKKRIPKEQLAILGSLIKINRIQQNMSQQALCEGICVPSYLSKIENGEVVPSLEMISALFENLDINYCDDLVFIDEKYQLMEQFYEELNVSGFAKCEEIYKRLEKEKEDLIHSPLVVEYYLLTFAYCCGTQKRQEFEAAKRILTSVLTQFTQKQRHRYNFYQGIDVLFLSCDLQAASAYFKSSNQYDTSGNSLHFLGMTTYMQGSYYEALEYLHEAQRLYMKERNLISIVYSYECLGIISYKMGSLERSLELLEVAVDYAKKLNRSDLMVMSLCFSGYVYYKKEAYDLATIALQKANEIKNELSLTWSDLEIIDFLMKEIIAKQRGIKPSMTDYSQCLNLDEKTKVGLQLLQINYDQNANQKELEELYQTYKLCSMVKFYLDVMVKDAMGSYYFRARKYKEACLMFDPAKS